VNEVYVIISYDIGVERVNKVNQFLKRYLYWRLNSLFEGDISESALAEVVDGLEGLINKNQDSILIYQLNSKKNVICTVIGVERSSLGLVL
jgi:CRISPR-associated protein Cas2